MLSPPLDFASGFIVDLAVADSCGYHHALTICELAPAKGHENSEIAIAETERWQMVRIV